MKYKTIFVTCLVVSKLKSSLLGETEVLSIGVPSPLWDKISPLSQQNDEPDQSQDVGRVLTGRLAA